MFKFQKQDIQGGLLTELLAQEFKSEKSGHPQVTFPTKERCPEIFNFFSDIAQQMGKNLVFIHANKFTVGDSAPWHNDVEGGTDTLAMLYLTNDVLVPDDGGLLQLGVKTGSDVELLASVCPNHGNLIYIDNTNHDLVHKVTPFLSHKQRFSVVGFLGTGQPVLGGKFE